MMGEKVLHKVLQRNRLETSGFSDISYALGSQGVYTKMFSGLNLEEQLFIGGASETYYEINTNGTYKTYKITEMYFLNSSDKNTYYKVTTEIDNTVLDFLTLPQDSFAVDDQEEDEETEAFPFLAQETEGAQRTMRITLSAVKGNTETELRKKYIVFGYNDNGRYIAEVLGSTSTSTSLS